MSRALSSLAIILLACLYGCGWSRSDVRGGETAIVRESAKSAPVNARSVTTREAIDPATGAVLEREITHRVEGGGESESVKVNATAKGASGSAAGENVKQDISGTPPVLNLGDIGSASGGGFGSTSSISGGAGGWPLYVTGGLLFVLGLGGMYIRQWRIGAIAIGGGLGLILVTIYPIVLWIVIGLGVVGLALWGMDATKKEKVMATLGKVARGVKNASDDARAAVKASIDKTTTDADDRIITEAKRKEGL